MKNYMQGSGFSAKYLGIRPVSTLAMFMGMIGIASAATLIDQNFDSGTVGLAPAGWTSTGSVVSNTVSVSNPNSLNHNTTSSYAYYNLASPLPLTSSAQLTLGYDVYVDTSATLHRFIMMNAATGTDSFGALGSVWFNGTTPTPTIQIRSGKSTIAASASFSLDTWYHVSIAMTLNESNFDVLVTQGVSTILTANNVSFDLGTNTALVNRPQFGTVYSSTEFSLSGANAYIDNVNLQSIPEPAMATYVLIGALAGLGFFKYQTRRAS